MTSPTYDTTLDPISPDFDPASWGADTPMLDEQGPLVTPDDRVEDLIRFHTTREGRPVSTLVVEGLIRRFDLTPPPDLSVKLLRARLTHGYPSVRRHDFVLRG